MVIFQKLSKGKFEMLSFMPFSIIVSNQVPPVNLLLKTGHEQSNYGQNGGEMKAVGLHLLKISKISWNQ